MSLNGTPGGLANSGDGVYLASDLPLGTSFTISVDSAPGYPNDPPYTTTLTVNGGNITTLTIELSKTTIPHVPEDISGDAVVDAVDVQLVINAALGLDIGSGLNADVTVKPPSFGPVLMRVSVFHVSAPMAHCVGGCGAERSEVEQTPTQCSANSLGVRLPSDVWGRLVL